MTEFVLNGEAVSADDDESIPLAYVLRNRFDLKSVKLGCEAEQCGACRIGVDGALAYACTTPLGAAAGRMLTTLEGLANGHVLSAVQDALLRHNATQCGYCLAGIAMAAHDLFERNRHPSRADIVAALEPHLCRCGAQPRVLRALTELAADA